MMPAVHERAAESPLASAPGSSIAQHPAITEIKNDSTVTEPVMPWANQHLPMQAPFSPPAAPAASLSPSFDDFAAEFSEGLQVAAAELGILEER
jgi:hypothetical protein